jgi:hypothetical protein
VANVSLRVPARNVTGFSAFDICTSARRAYAANVAVTDLAILAIGAVSLNFFYLLPKLLIVFKALYNVVFIY